MSNTNYKIEVMQAFIHGKEIEYKDGVNWFPASTPCWDWVKYDYRVKPELIEAWCNVYPNAEHNTVYLSKERADAVHGPNRIRCAHLVEVEDD